MAAMLAVTVGIAHAEVVADAIPADVLAQVAMFAVPLIQTQFPNPPVKIDPATDKVIGYHVDQKVALLMMPDKAFTAKSIEEAGEKEVPVGVIATRSLSLQEKDAVVGGDRLAVADFNGLYKLPVFFLAVKGNGADRILEVYSKEGKSLLSVPLKKQASDAAIPLNVKLTNIDLEKKKMDATLSLGGAYEGTLNLGIVEL
jgi:hypothetical protein